MWCNNKKKSFGHLRECPITLYHIRHIAMFIHRNVGCQERPTYKQTRNIHHHHHQIWLLIMNWQSKRKTMHKMERKHHRYLATTWFNYVWCNKMSKNKKPQTTSTPDTIAKSGKRMKERRWQSFFNSIFCNCFDMCFLSESSIILITLLQLS
jgi:hypothetical protein